MRSRPGVGARPSKDGDPRKCSPHEPYARSSARVALARRSRAGPGQHLTGSTCQSRADAVRIASGRTSTVASPRQPVEILGCSSLPPKRPRATNASGARPPSNEDGVRERFASSSHSIVQGAQEVVAMTVKSWRSVMVGASIALVVPISYWVLASLVENGIAPYDQTHALFDLIGLLGWISLFLLGPIRIVLAGRSAGVRGALAWLALLMWALPVFAFVCFVCAASVSGALANRF